MQVASSIGPYEITAKLGAGGMGDVYRARDPRIEREVAIKVLPAEFGADPERLRRFAQEARAAGALNHPNVLAVFDVGEHEGAPYLVTELLEGETLRERLDGGAIAKRKAIEIAVQVARGLAAAHEKGIIHRDLKPENVWLTKDGHVKILDFGLAKVDGPIVAESGKTLTTPPEGATGPGVMLGTVGYMSPEQVRGLPADARSDIFSFGAVLYEMLSGQRAFQRETAAESMTAILKEDPPELVMPGAPTSPALARLVDRCLRKDPAERWQSARDLGFALEHATGDSGVSSSAAVSAKPKRWRVPVAVLGGVALASLAYMAGSRRAPVSHPAFRPLTRERGAVSAARFVPGTSDVAYSARWGGEGSHLYVTRMDQAAPRSLPDFEGLLESVSASGDVMGLADTFLYSGLQHGRLISGSLSGGAVRALAEGVTSADQRKAGEAALVIFEHGVYRLEWPYGHEIVRTFDGLRTVRIREDRLAFFQDQENTAEDGNVLVADRTGSPKRLTFFKGFTGMAWGPSGKEVWVSTFSDGESRIVSVDLGGRSRILLTHAGRLELQDVDGHGRVLAVVHSYQRQVFGRARGKERDEDLAWRDAQSVLSISRDGRLVLLAHRTAWLASGGRLYLRPLDGGPAQDLGEGFGEPVLSADGRWVTSWTSTPVFSLKILPIGPGVPRTVPIPDFAGSDFGGEFLPDGRHVIGVGRVKNGPSSIFQVDLDTGAYRQVAPDATDTFNAQTLLSPDGGSIAFEMLSGPAVSADGERPVTVCRADGSDPRAVHGLRRVEAISGWYRDASALVVFDRNVLPAPVIVLDVATGKRTPLMTIMPPDPVGIAGVEGLCLAPDGGAYAYNVVRQLSELYLIEGLR